MIFLALDLVNLVFILPVIVGISTFMNEIHFMFNLVEHGKRLYPWSKVKVSLFLQAIVFDS